MGMIGRWIDARTDTERDRIITHPDPTFDGQCWWGEDGQDCGCLVGCVLWASDPYASDLADLPIEENRRLVEIDPPQLVHGWPQDTPVSRRFPDLTLRFGAERMWRLVKARAAKANRVVIPARETAAPR